MYSQIQEEAVESGATGDEVASAQAPLANDTAQADARRPSLASLKSEIARAMQVAADHERERIDAGLGEEESAQVEKIVGRAAAEAAELSKHADEDVSLVNTRYKDEVKRIRTEADRQIDDRRMGLEQSLTHHGSLIEAEIESVHVAVQGYRDSLGAFFGRLAEERDPSAIARLAGDLPDPPDLDDVRAEARASAMQALEQRSSAKTPEPTHANPTNGNGRNGLERESVPVMEPGADMQRGGTLDGTTIVLAAAVASAPVADEASSSPVEPVVDVTASPELSPTRETVAARVIRALKYRPAPTETPEDK